MRKWLISLNRVRINIIKNLLNVEINKYLRKEQKSER